VRDGIPGIELACVSARDKERARGTLRDYGIDVPVVDLPDLIERSEIVVECLPPELFADVAGPTVSAGKTLVTCSAGGLVQNADVIEMAERNGGRILVPSGALCGLDAVRAAAEGTVHSVRMVTRKPVKGLQDAPHFAENGIDLGQATEPVLLFQGTAAEAIKGYPANVNVAVALGLAGTGPENTMIEIWADPALDRNTHEIVVESDSARLTYKIENIPTEENPKTGKITALSVVALLRGLGGTLRVGT